MYFDVYIECNFFCCYFYIEHRKVRANFFCGIIYCMRPITKTFLRIEERARRFFEKLPFVQAFLAGIGVIIFWRGIWELLDRNNVSPIVSVVVGSLILGGVGVFVQTFIGNTIIIREVKQEEKIEKKAMEKIEETVPEPTLAEISKKLDMLLLQKEDGI